MLIVAKPQSHILVVVHEKESALAMLLVLKPFALIFFTVREGIYPISLALAFDIIPFVEVAVLVGGLAFAVGLARHHFTLIYTAVLGFARAQSDFLCEG